MNIGDALRHARESAGRTLDELSATTRINRKFLEEIETGTSTLPPIYANAFTKSYARELGVDPDEFVTRESSPPVSTPGAALLPDEDLVTADDRAGRRDAGAEVITKSGKRAENPRQVGILALLVLFIIGGLVLSVNWLRSGRESPPVEEISFSEVVKQLDQSHAQVESLVHVASQPDSDTSPAAVPSPPDSLVLSATTTENVWVQVVIDGGETLEYNLPPGYNATWRAMDNFTLSIGNPRAIGFSLNGKKLGKLASGSKPINDIRVNRQSLTDGDGASAPAQ